MGKQVKHSWLGSNIGGRFRNRGAGSAKNASSPQVTPPETSVSVERPATGQKTEKKTTGRNIEVEAVATNGDSVQPVSQRTERVALPHLIDEVHPNPRVSKAREKLQESTEQLEVSLVNYARKFEDRPPFEDADVKNILANGSQSSPLSGDDFGRFIDQVLSDQKTDSGRVRGRVAACKSKVYPIATFSLGIVSFTADAAGFLPLKITANGLTQVISLASKEHSRSGDIISVLDNLSSHQSFFEDLRGIGAEELPPSIQEHATLLLPLSPGTCA
ncbi:MAG: hypothetical protein L6R42_000027 [Xanthoria sp. 1 TBL-2021]|nr:MAG: hypothetical protein L6R42_000027 [Xanthoria sp. 1 TBL-2021]